MIKIKKYSDLSKFIKLFTILRYKINTELRRFSLKISPLKISDDEFWDIIGFNTINKFEKQKYSGFFFNNKNKLTTFILREKSVNNDLMDANKICDHEFNLLGSEDTFLGHEIDWHLDFKTGYRWDHNKYYIGNNKHLEYQKKGINADIKVPWELSRFYHVVTIGKAYWYTNNEKYAKEFKSQIESWIKNNPVEIGVNWTSAMEVAIRAINWIWGYYYFSNSKTLTTDFRIQFFKSLILHGKFIENHLELKYHNNHYLSDIVGLVYLGIFFKESEIGNKWLKKGLNALKEEMSFQVLSDGVHCEGSTSYHRLVTELFISATILCVNNNIKFPEWYMQRLELMCHFIKYYTKPDGSSPQIGDFDDGRLHVLSNYGDWDKLDHSYLLPIANELFQRPNFSINIFTLEEDAFWLLGGQLYDSDVEKGINDVGSKAFPKAGFYIMRDNDYFMIIDALSPDMKYSQGHRHNSALNFELFGGDKTFIIDPGSYIYTADKKMRNLFRSTEYHNIIQVDKEEQNCYNKDELFDMGSDAKVDVINFKISENFDYFEGLHHGYERLKEPVTHRRQITFNKKEKYWLIKDLLEGEGKHKFELNFHFAPMELSFLEKNDHMVISKTNGTNIVVIPINLEGISSEICDGWVSYSYGKKVKGSILKYSKESNTPTTFVTLLFPFDKEEDLDIFLDGLERFDKELDCS